MVMPDTLPVAVEDVAPFGKLLRPETPDADITVVPVSVARDLARQHRLLVLRGFRGISSAEQLESYAASWGQLMRWPFGYVLELVEQEQPLDHVFDSSWMPYHWDGVFVAQIPEFQIFQCVSAPGEGHGGRTTFCDTTRVLDAAPPRTRRLWEAATVTYQIKNRSHYGGTAVSPVVAPHPDRGFPTIRYAEPVPDDIEFHNRPLMTFAGVPAERVAETTTTLREALYDKRHQYAHEWRTGDIVISDNYVNLHGREAYTSRCGRHLRRVHVLGDPPLANPALRS